MNTHLQDQAQETQTSCIENCDNFETFHGENQGEDGSLRKICFPEDGQWLNEMVYLGGESS